MIFLAINSSYKFKYQAYSALFLAAHTEYWNLTTQPIYIGYE